MQDKQKVGLIVTLVTAFTCACPGLCAIAFGVMLIYVVSMFIRSRNLKRDLSMLEEMDKEK